MRRILWLFLFAAAMAVVEAAVVVYLRLLYYPENLQVIFPLRLMQLDHFTIEVGREVATMVMLAAVAALATKSVLHRFAVFCYLMGLWDLFYYVWLKVMIGWPVSWFEWDVLFLIPWPWLGPWLCSAAIALLFVAWGAHVLSADGEFAFTGRKLWLFITGSCLGLAAFLWPAFFVLWHEGPKGLAGWSPAGFPWPLYLIAIVLMAAGLPWRQRRVFAP